MTERPAQLVKSTLPVNSV